MVMGIEPVFMVATGVPETLSYLGLGGACAALWKRAQILQDRKDAGDAIHAQRYADLVERCTSALDRTANALEEAVERLRAG